MIENNLFSELGSLTTEMRNEASSNIDLLDTESILRIINNEDKLVALAVEKEISWITKAADAVTKSFLSGGRLIYFGAGTSGRLGVVDASECPPTFGVPFEMVQGFIADGREAMFRAQEGAEDYEENGAADVDKANVTEKDVVCGIAASKRTPYSIGAVKRAKELGAVTIFLTCNPRENVCIPEADITICPYVGPEVITGSTRMKSGTAQKLVLNMITTTAMVKLGKTYENLMIDLQLTNKKLEERAKKIIMTITGVSYLEAESFLKEANGHVKTALVMIIAKVSKEDAEQKISAAGGFIRKAIQL